MLTTLIPFLLALPTGEVRNWTVLFYGASDNDSEESFCPDVEEARRALVPGQGVELLALVDRSPRYSDTKQGFGEDFSDTRLYRLTPQGPERAAGGEHFAEITLESHHEANSGSAETLRKALRWMKAEYPARHYALVFYSHGSGNLWCPDEEDGGDHLFPAELTEELSEGDSLDLVVFDVCLMAGLENAYQWRPGTGRFAMDVMVATPMAGFPFPWGRILARMHARDQDPGQLDARGFGRLVVEETQGHREAEIAQNDLPPDLVDAIEREAMVCLDLSAAGQVKERLDRLARLLARSGGRALLEDVRGTTSAARCLNYMLPEARAWTTPYFDLFDLAQRLAQHEGADGELRAAASAVADAVEDANLASYGLAGYDGQGGFRAGQHGLYVVLPDGDPRPPFGRSSWSAFGWYHPGPVEGTDVYGCYAFCGDGATAGDGVVDNWFELLDSWYDEADEDGGSNGYRW